MIKVKESILIFVIASAGLIAPSLLVESQENINGYSHTRYANRENAGDDVIANSFEEAFMWENPKFGKLLQYNNPINQDNNDGEVDLDSGTWYVQDGVENVSDTKVVFNNEMEMEGIYFYTTNDDLFNNVLMHNPVNVGLTSDEGDKTFGELDPVSVAFEVTEGSEKFWVKAEETDEEGYFEFVNTLSSPIGKSGKLTNMYFGFTDPDTGEVLWSPQGFEDEKIGVNFNRLFQSDARTITSPSLSDPIITKNGSFDYDYSIEWGFNNIIKEDGKENLDIFDSILAKEHYTGVELINKSGEIKFKYETTTALEPVTTLSTNINIEVSGYEEEGFESFKNLTYIDIVASTAGTELIFPINLSGAPEGDESDIQIVTGSTTDHSFRIKVPHSEEGITEKSEVILQDGDGTERTISNENLTRVEATDEFDIIEVSGLESNETYFLRSVTYGGFNYTVTNDSNRLSETTLPHYPVVEVFLIMLLIFILLIILIALLVKFNKTKNYRKKIHFHSDAHGYTENYVEKIMFNTHKCKKVVQTPVNELEMYFLDQKLDVIFLRDTSYKKGQMRFRIMLDQFKDKETAAKILAGALHDQMTLRRNGEVLARIHYLEGKELKKAIESAMRENAGLILSSSDNLKDSIEIEDERIVASSNPNAQRLSKEELTKIQKLPLFKKAKELGIEGYQEMSIQELTKEIYLEEEIRRREALKQTPVEEAPTKEEPEKSLESMTKKELLDVASEIWERESIKTYTKKELIELINSEN